MAKHGLENPAGPHAGDLPNIEFDEAGNATYDTTAISVTRTGEMHCWLPMAVHSRSMPRPMTSTPIQRD